MCTLNSWVSVDNKWIHAIPPESRDRTFPLIQKVVMCPFSQLVSLHPPKSNPSSHLITRSYFYHRMTKYNPTYLHEILFLTSFTQPEVLGAIGVVLCIVVHSFLSASGSVYCMNIPQCPFAHLSCFYFVANMNKAAINRDKPCMDVSFHYPFVKT